MMETLDLKPECAVAEAEYRRLLGYPRGHQPGDRALELAAWARGWFAEHGRPWVYLREVPVTVTTDALRIDTTPFQSRKLREHFLAAGVDRALVVAVSAGPEAEARARELWGEAKPDEYFFLEVFGSAVVEHLVAATNGRVCALAEANGLRAIPHYSPGYTGWEVAEQNELFALIERGRTKPWPAPLHVLPSGMVQPKKSLLAVIGLTARPVAEAPAVPCVACSFSPCQYRRAAYRHEAPAAAAPARGYKVSPRALRKWAQERVQLEPRPDGTLAATFRFDGTTCSNLGHPLAFDYRLVLGPAAAGRRILATACAPAAGDPGYENMCAYLNDPDGLMQAIATAPSLVGQPLDAVLDWERATAPAGCHCTADSREHKWGLALEAIHFALAQTPAAATVPPPPQPVPSHS